MLAGLLNESIVFRKPLITKTKTGSEVTTYVDDIRCKAQVQVQSGTKQNENGDIVFSKQVIFTIRRFYNINELHRIYWRLHDYEIKFILYNKSRQYIQITTELINNFEIPKDYQ